MHKDAGRIGVFGASGSGKSTRVKAQIAGHNRIVCFDPLDEYSRAGKFTACRSLAQVLAAFKRGWARGFRIAYVPPAGNEADALHRLALLLQAAQRPYFEERDPRKIALVVEEMNLSFPVAALPRNLYGFADLCSRGRHYGIEIIGVAQRFSEVSTRFRGNMTEAYYFRAADHVDVATAARMLGRARAEELRTLPVHHYFHVKGPDVSKGVNSLRGKRA